MPIEPFTGATLLSDLWARATAPSGSATTILMQNLRVCGIGRSIANDEEPQIIYSSMQRARMQLRKKRPYW
jgi:hypothetical protein